MSFYNHNHAASSRGARAFIALSLTFAMLCASGTAFAIDTGDIIVASSKGEVHFTINGAERTLRAGSALELPATVRTGRDGAIELRQGATSISVGPDTLLEFPALAAPGGPIDRVVQPRGNAFYSIGKRPGRKLRVETPFLVGVVKGTQFNVAAQAHATTISLYEGLLEIRSADESDVIDLHAGEIARRDRFASDISVLKMDGKVPVVPKAPAGAGGSNNAPAPTPNPSPPRPQQNVEGDERFAARGIETQPVAEVAVPAVVETHTEVVTSAPVDTGTAVDVVADTPAVTVDTGTRVDVVAETPAATVDVVTSTPVDTSTSVSVVVDTPAVTVDTSAAIGNATVDGGASVDLGSTPTVTVDADVDVDLGLDDDAKGNNGNANGIGNGNGYGNGNGNGGGNGLVGSATETVSDVVTTTTDVVTDVSELLDKLTKKPGKK